MDFQVWFKEEFGDTFTKVDCGDLLAAKREIEEAYKVGKDPILTVEVPYSLAIKVEAVGTEKPKRKADKRVAVIKLEEEPEGEVNQGETEPGQDPGTES